MAINFSDGSDYVIYMAWGKTYIGKFYKSGASKPGNFGATGGTHASLGYDSTSYIIENPCEIELDLSIPSTGSAQLAWKLKPAFYKDLIGTTDTNYHTFVFSLPRSQVAISNVGGDIIDSTLLAAYEELCF
jgi:hypothetical protein